MSAPLPPGFRVTVYAGSSSATAPAAFTPATAAFITDAVAAGAEIVYGGGTVGLMGVVADAALSAGGKVTGVIPRSQFDAGMAHKSLTDLLVVKSMAARKRLMTELGDCFVALPGDAGTIAELFEAWSGLILGEHDKPVTVLNLNGYWDRLLQLNGRMTRSGFLQQPERDTLIPLSNAQDLLALLAKWSPPPPRWNSKTVVPDVENR